MRTATFTALPSPVFLKGTTVESVSEESDMDGDGFDRESIPPRCPRLRLRAYAGWLYLALAPHRARPVRRLRAGFALALVGLCIVAIPLFSNGITQIRTTILSTTGAPVVRDWIGPRNLEVTSWAIEGDEVTLDLRGTEAPAPAEGLARSLAATFGSPVTVVVRYTPYEEERGAASP